MHWLDEVLSVVQAFENEFTQVDVLAQIAQVLVEVEHLTQARVVAKRALQVANSTEDDRHRSDILAQAARILTQVKLFPLAHNIAIQALRLAHSLRYNNMHEFVLKSVVQELAQSHFFARALEVAHFFERPYCRAEALIRAADAFAQAQHFDEACKVATEALEIARNVEDTSRGYLLAGVARAFAQAQSFEEAHTIAVEALGVAYRFAHPDHIVLLQMIINSLAEAQLFKQEHDITVQALKLAYKLEQNHVARSEFLKYIANALAKAHRFAEALHIAHDIKYVFRSYALSSIACNLAQVDRFEEALQVAHSIEDDMICAQALANIALFLARAGHTEQSTNVAMQVMKALSGVTHYIGTSEVLTPIAQILARAGHLQQALKMIADFNDEFGRIHLLADLAQSLTKGGQFAEAQEVAEQALQVFLSMGRTDSIGPFIKIAQVFAQIQRFEQARFVAEHALANARTIDNISRRAYALNGVAEAFIHAQHPRQAHVTAMEALHLARSINKEQRRRVLVEVTRVFAQLHPPE